MFGLLPFGLVNGSSGIGGVLQGIMQNFFNGNIMSDFNANDMFRAAVKETPEGYIICADVHGVHKDDIKMSYKNECFTISVIRRIGSEHSGNCFRIVQGCIDQMARSFHVKNVNVNLMKVNFKDNILIVAIPKKDRYLESEGRVLIE